jgi:UDP-N-acetylglucosamine acyltransferase
MRHHQPRHGAGRGLTRIGDDNWIMAYAHIAHDCVVGNNVILANNVALAGHCRVGDWAIFGGYSGLHQFCRAGAHCFLGKYAGVSQDVPAYVMVGGYPPAAARHQRRGAQAPRLQRRADREHPPRLQAAVPQRP